MEAKHRLSISITLNNPDIMTLCDKSITLSSSSRQNKLSLNMKEVKEEEM